VNSQAGHKKQLPARPRKIAEMGVDMFPSSRRPILSPPQTPKNYRITVLTERCDGCRLCTLFCPLEVLVISAETNRRMLHFAEVADPSGCLGCGQCERLCPTASIFVSEVDREGEVLP
jgi:2-oxoglutarate ferredoxin oxidoreductase subunit delta